MPLFRFGQGHAVNNFYENITSTAINSRMGARIRIKGNHFEYVNNPIVSFYSQGYSFYSDTQGYWETDHPLVKTSRVGCHACIRNTLYTYPWAFDVCAATNACFGNFSYRGK